MGLAVENPVSGHFWHRQEPVHRIPVCPDGPLSRLKGVH